MSKKKRAKKRAAQAAAAAAAAQAIARQNAEKLLECLKEKYDTVSPGEVCSLTVASKYGILDINNYYTAGYDSVRTYNEEKDAKENRSKSLCVQAENKSNAFPHCVLEHGIGFVRKAGVPGKCVTVSCPTGFTNENGVCKKPLEDYMVSKRSRCDERTYDWFMVPNHHLGNGVFSEKVGTCYAPCPKDHVPQFAVDPVDETSTGFAASKDMSRCVPRELYAGGKYSEGSDYCPISWIYRLTLTPEVAKQHLQQSLDELRNKVGGATGENMNAIYAKTLQGIDLEAQRLSKEAGSLIDNIPIPSTTMADACQKLNTQERLKYAYEVCERLQTDPSYFTKMFADMGDSEHIQQQKLNMLKQACNALFCNMNDDQSSKLDKPNICFPDITETIVDTVRPEEDASKLPPPTADKGMKFLRRQVINAAILLCIGIFGVLFVLFITRFLYPKVYIPISEKIKEFFSGYRESGYVKKVSSAAE